MSKKLYIRYMVKDEKIKTLIKVAKLYYLGHMTQQEIADMLDTSRSTIARMLIEAERKKIVRIEISDTYFDFEQASEEIKKAYGLQFVEIVPSSTNISSTRLTMGEVATSHLNSYIKENSRIGLSWGNNISAFVSAYHSKKTYPHAKVVQMVGGFYNSINYMDGHDLARKLADKMGCEFSCLQAPMFVSNEELRDLMLQEEDTKAHFELMEQIDIAVMSIGFADYSETPSFYEKYLDEKSAKEINSRGLCNICGHQIDMYGNEPETSLSKRHIGISLETIRKIPMVIGMCNGNNKTAAILSVINGGYINGLIIDEVAAIPLLHVEGIEL